MIQLSFHQSTFRNVTGYRFAMTLLPGGQLSAHLQVTLEIQSPFSNIPGQHGRRIPDSFLSAGPMPNVNDVGNITVGTPLNGRITTGLILTNFRLAGSDSRSAGEFSYSLLDFADSPAPAQWTVTSTAPIVSPNLNADCGGLVCLRGNNGPYKAIRDISSPGKVVSWRTDRCSVDDPISWMTANANNGWNVLPFFKWNDARATNPQQPQPNPNPPKGMLYEELYGRFVHCKRFTARRLEECFSNIGGLSVTELLVCNLDDVIPSPKRDDPPLVGYNVTGCVEERVSIIYGNDVNFPT